MASLTDLLDRLADPALLDGTALLAELRDHPGLQDAPPATLAAAATALVTHGSVRELDRAADLAWRAHSGGDADAGPLFASCADRLALLSGRPQHFGTISVEHQGDLVLAPVDPAVGDDARATVGVAPLAVLRAGVDEANRQRARDRAAAGDLPAGQLFGRVWLDPTAAQLRARMALEGAPVWQDGDVLTFVCDRPLAGAIVGPLFELPMWRVDDLLVLQIRMERLDEAVLTYGFWPLDEQGRAAFTHRPEPDGRWRGAAAPPAAPTNDPPLGEVVDTVVESPSLGEARRVTVYLPPGHTPAERLPVVYATDGQFFAPYARRVDAAIANGTIPRVVIVAAHAAGFDPARGGNVRALEYLPSFDARTFDRHQRFFTGELVAWAEQTYGVASEREARAVFGCSDGGGHALAVGLLHHERFGHVIAYSTGMPPSGREQWPAATTPYVQLCAGILEREFFMATAAWAQFLSMTGVAHHWTERVCGHELLQWIEELPGAIGRAFGD